MNLRKTFIVKEKITIKEFHPSAESKRTEVLYSIKETLRPLGWLILPFAYLVQGFMDGFPGATKDYIKIIKDKGRVWSSTKYSSKEKFIENYGKKAINKFTKNEEK